MTRAKTGFIRVCKIRLMKRCPTITLNSRCYKVALA